MILQALLKDKNLSLSKDKIKLISRRQTKCSANSEQSCFMINKIFLLCV